MLASLFQVELKKQFFSKCYSLEKGEVSSSVLPLDKRVLLMLISLKSMFKGRDNLILLSSIMY